MKKYIVIVLLFAMIGTAVGGVCSSAYEIMYEAGFYPVPAYISCHSSFASSTLSAVHNACLAWNGAGAGSIVYRTTASHNTAQWPVRNGANEITKSVVSNDDVLM